MQILWNKNPLATQVVLDEHEKKELWYKIKCEQLVESLFSVHYELVYKKEKADLERCKEEVDPKYYLDEDQPDRSPLDKRCDELLEHYLEELNGRHLGDCTCFAMSCSKCHAESMLGIDTIKGLGKHSAYKIDSAFGKNNELTMAEALELLKNYEPTATWEGWEAHVPRWKAEAKAAYEWLLNYSNQHPEL